MPEELLTMYEMDNALARIIMYANPKIRLNLLCRVLRRLWVCISTQEVSMRSHMKQARASMS